MRAVFVNYVHPATPHVSGMRVSSFAEALARKGHQIVLLTRSLYGTEENKSPEQVARELREHDWSRPYHIACSPGNDEKLRNLREGRSSALIRKWIILTYYLHYSGVFHDWTEGTRPYWPVLVKTFKPDVTWGTFGNTDTWVVAQGIARLAQVPWVRDVKDGWDPFIPGPLRRLIARRFRDGAALTTNSQYQADLSRRWFPNEPVVVYSGVPSCFLNGAPPSRPHDGFRLTLVGSIYSEENLDEFMTGLRTWLAGLLPEQRSRVYFAYAGGEREKLARASRALDGLCRVELHGYLDLEKLFELCAGSAANAYLWSPKTFHHKLIELLCCQRPVVAFPGEREEAIGLAKQLNIELEICVNPSALAECLNLLWKKWNQAITNVSDSKVFYQFSWDSQAERLVNVLENTIRTGRFPKRCVSR